MRIPALLISPRIVAGSVFRSRTGTIDHTSVLKTLELRWNLDPLTNRDKKAPDLGDVLTLATPRTDDPIEGIAIPLPSAPPHPNQSQPSIIEKIHATRVSQLPIRNSEGSYDHTPPDLSSSAQISDYIQARTAAWPVGASGEKRHPEA